MLVLSRKLGEKIVLPEQMIEVTVLEIRGDRVRIGITAPSDVPVHRQEVWERIQKFHEEPEVAIEKAPVTR